MGDEQAESYMPQSRKHGVDGWSVRTIEPQITSQIGQRRLLEEIQTTLVVGMFYKSGLFIECSVSIDSTSADTPLIPTLLLSGTSIHPYTKDLPCRDILGRLYVPRG